MNASRSVVPAERIEKSILFIRGQKVLLDTVLAELYGVETKVLLQSVRRNIARFPEDFMFQLSPEEHKLLKTQTVISVGRGGRRYPPFAFTEQGVAMLSSVINSPRAITVNIEIMRTFVRLRKMLMAHKELAQKIDALEKKYDAQFRVVFDAIRQLMSPPKPKKNQIGFHWETKEASGKKALAKKQVPRKKKALAKKQVPPKKKTLAKKKR